MSLASAVLLAALSWGEARVPADTNLVLHSTVGAWFMLIRVDCDRWPGMEAEILDPTGKVLCPLAAPNIASKVVENRCDCLALRLDPRAGHFGSSALQAEAWRPQSGRYRIRVRAFEPGRVSIRAGARYAVHAHWGRTDTLTLQSGDLREWTIRWAPVSRGDSTRTRLMRVR